MRIITVPHPTLRATATEVTEVTPALQKFVADLENTLSSTRNPRGVGLAATQVDKTHRIFALAVDAVRTFINPRMVSKSPRQTLGKNADEPVLEGCLSIPKIYGPVPRWEWIDLEYLELVGDELIERAERLDAFAARVAQHELDHLDGILFTDYALEYDMPVYQENAKTKQLEEIDHTLIKLY